MDKRRTIEEARALGREALGNGREPRADGTIDAVFSLTLPLSASL